MAPNSSLVMSSRLAMNRFSRSASSMMVASRSALAASSSDFAMSRRAPAAPSTEASGVLRSCEIEVRSADRSRSVSIVRLTRSMSSTRRTRSIASAAWSIRASSRRRWSARQQRTGPLAVDAEDADRSAARSHRQEQPLGAGQRIGVPARGSILLPGPAGGGEVRFLERILRRVAGLDRNRAVFGQQQARPAPSASARSGRWWPKGRRREVRRRQACD